jgi:hypothetical protein
LLVYRYGSGSLSWKTPRSLLQRIRAAIFEERFLAPRAGASAASATLPPMWRPPSADDNDHDEPFPRAFTVWGAGRDGKAFYNALSPAGQAQVLAFADIDPRKVGLAYPAGRVVEGGVGGVGGGVGGGTGGGGLPTSKRAQKKLDRAAEKMKKRALPEEQDVGAAAAPGEKRARAIEGGGERTAGAAALPCPPPPAPRPGPRPIVHISSAAFPVVCCVSLEAGGDELVTNMGRIGGGGGGGGEGRAAAEASSSSSSSSSLSSPSGPLAWPPGVRPGENIVFFV